REGTHGKFRRAVDGVTRIDHVTLDGGYVDDVPRLLRLHVRKRCCDALSEGLRKEVKPYNIRTTIISPGAVSTELLE
ncbi:hypothetical protein ACC689_36385, partial [Rhizobium ruizarguesonis]